MFKSLPRLVFLALRNGSIAAVVAFILMIALYFMGRHPFLFPLFFDFRVVLLTVFMIFMLKELRDYHQGILFFGQAMICNFLFTIVFALMAATLVWVWCAIYPAFLTDYIQTATEQVKSIQQAVIEQLGKETYEQNLAKLPNTTGFTLALDYIAKTFIISFFVSVIISVILRRQPKTI